MTSVAILGSGAVGVACAGPLLQLGLASQLTLYDRDGERARGEAPILTPAIPATKPAVIRIEKATPVGPLRRVLPRKRR